MAIDMVMVSFIERLQTPRDPWVKQDRDQWFAGQRRVKPYEDLIKRIENAAQNFNISSYGALSYYPEKYPLLKVSIGEWGNGKPEIIITGGVHGYEPSGEEACIRFLETDAPRLSKKFNISVYPCISPTAFEMNHRWNNFAHDVNRDFDPALLTASEEIQAEHAEAILFMQDIIQGNRQIALAVDLHETPAMDVELRIMRALRYGTALSKDYQKLPNGSYILIGNETQSKEGRIVVPQFAKSAIEGLKEQAPVVTDDDIIGLENHGGIGISGTSNTLRHFMSRSTPIAVTTEICPETINAANDKDRLEKSVQAQLAITRALARHVA